MGRDRETSQGTQQSTTTQDTTTTNITKVEPSEEERRLNQLEIERIEATQGGLIDAQRSGLDLINQLLQGKEGPGFFADLGKGISGDVTDSIVSESLKDLRTEFQGSGLLDSGVRASVSGRVAGDIRRASEEFNIGARQNLLNLALSGQAQVQAPALAQSANLGARLAGLRSVSQTGGVRGTTGFSGSSSQTITRPNPFFQSFQTSFGSTLGSRLGNARV